MFRLSSLVVERWPFKPTTGVRFPSRVLLSLFFLLPPFSRPAKARAWFPAPRFLRHSLRNATPLFLSLTSVRRVPWALTTPRSFTGVPFESLFRRAPPTTTALHAPLKSKPPFANGQAYGPLLPLPNEYHLRLKFWISRFNSVGGPDYHGSLSRHVLQS